MGSPTPNSNPTDEESSRCLDKALTPPSCITGGCLCGKVRYRAEIGEKYAWPPGPHTCSCTHCRKHTGAPFALFLTFTCPQLDWPSPEIGMPRVSNVADNKAQAPSTAVGEEDHNVSDILSRQVVNLSITEYSHTPGRYRGFCGSCGSTMYWRCPDEDGDEIEMGVGTVDEELLEKYGRMLCAPSRGRFHAGREIHGVGFGGEFEPRISGPRFKEGSRSEKLE